jgi:hypothetical protein
MALTEHSETEVSIQRVASRVVQHTEAECSTVVHSLLSVYAELTSHSIVRFAARFL